ncbi:MAG: type II secretion system protein [Gemmatimonadota bacterium]|jgi:prepilin-type N-terminal cleavage/methylation domain-containing protein
MKPWRRGFTLIELLMVLVIIAILVTIGLNRFWSVKDEGLLSTLRSDLRNLATAQEDYFAANYTYANAAADLDPVGFRPSPGVTININVVQQDGWAGDATHVSLGTRQCGIFTGNAPAAQGAPATVPGVIACN